MKERLNGGVIIALLARVQEVIRYAGFVFDTWAERAKYSPKNLEGIVAST